MGARKAEWITPEIIARMGKEPDRVVGASCGKSASRISAVRGELGIKPYPETLRQSRLTADVVARIGTLPDKTLADECGLQRALIRQMRQDMGIACYRVGRIADSIPPDIVAMIGNHPDSAVARLAGVKEGLIADERRMRGIPSWRATYEPGCDISDRLGKQTDASIAEHYGFSRRSVSNWRTARGIDAYPRAKAELPAEAVQLMGVLPDKEVAERAGVHWAVAFARRKILGVAAFGGGRAPEWLTPDVVAKMGVVSDRKLAEDLQVGEAAVARNRRMLGIDARFQQPRPAWTRCASTLAQLRVETDISMAAKLGLHPATVTIHRAALGIGHPPRPPQDYTSSARRGASTRRANALKAGLAKLTTLDATTLKLQKL